MYIIPPTERSWIDVAPGSHFPIQNLPLGLALIDEAEAVVTRIGDMVLNLSGLIESNWLPETGPIQYGEMEITTAQASELRRRVFEILKESNRNKSDAIRARYLFDVDDVELLVPMPIGAFVDFYSGINHANNVGKMFRPEAPPLLPNYRHLPIAYNGRASSIQVSGSPIPRPMGVYKDGENIVFGPTRELDFELEVGFFLAAPEIGEDEDIPPVNSPEAADERILGFVLVNDWSARDVQRFENQPLGPFLSKSFATSVSPWIILKDALEPFRTEGPKQEPAPLPHLRASGARHYDIDLQIGLQSHRMDELQVISETNYTELYWSPTQQLLHQASNGTMLEPGDLYASGTVSGTSPDSFGSLLELTWRGEKPLTLEESGEKRSFLEDGDSVVMSGVCQKPGLTLGFGEVEGTVFPALPR